MVAMRVRLISVLGQAFGRGTRAWSMCSLASFALAALLLACEGESTHAPPAPAASEAPSPPPVEAKKASTSTKGGTDVPQATPTTPSSAEVLTPTPTPVVDRGDRQRLLLKHYAALRCIASKGGDSGAQAKAFGDSGLDPELWNQALGELLETLRAEPEGETARAIMAIDEAPCSKEAQP